VGLPLAICGPKACLRLPSVASVDGRVSTYLISLLPLKSCVVSLDPEIGWER
jgi:hypothetical protein